jgi:hypothetical protein
MSAENTERRSVDSLLHEIEGWRVLDENQSAELEAHRRHLARLQSAVTRARDHVHTIAGDSITEQTITLIDVLMEHDRERRQLLVEEQRLLQKNAELEADAMRYRELRDQMQIEQRSMDPDGQGPFRHFLTLKVGVVFIPGSGNTTVPEVTPALIDAAIDARIGDCNAYIIALAAAHSTPEVPDA